MLRTVVQMLAPRGMQEGRVLSLWRAGALTSLQVRSAGFIAQASVADARQATAELIEVRAHSSQAEHAVDSAREHGLTVVVSN